MATSAFEGNETHSRIQKLRDSYQQELEVIIVRLDKGKGTHGEPGYVTDYTWQQWETKRSHFERFILDLNSLLNLGAVERVVHQLIDEDFLETCMLQKELARHRKLVLRMKKAMDKFTDY